MDKKSEHQDQIDEISKQIVKKPDNVSLYIERANLYQETFLDLSTENKIYDEEWKKKYKEDTKKVFDIAPSTNLDILNKSWFCQQNNNYEKAIEGYSKLINIEKRSRKSILFYLRGFCFFYLKNYSKATGDLTNAEKLYQDEKDKSFFDIDYLYAYCGLSNFFLEKFSDAYSDFSKLLNKETRKFKEIHIFKDTSLNKYQIPYYYAISCYFTGKYKEALIHLNEIIENDPQNYRAICYRMLIHKKLKNINQAKKDEKIINQALINNDKVCEDIGLIYYQINDWEKAIKCFRKIDLMGGKEVVEKIEKISNYYLQQGEYDKAKKVCVGYPGNLKIEERNKIIADLSHSIKNMISSVIDPLENLKKEKGVKPIIIDNALRGSNLIREIVNAMSLSFKGSFDDFIYDARYNSEKESMNINSMFIESLKHAVINMFDGKYFTNFMHKYFPLKDSYLKAKEDWDKISQSQDKQKIDTFLKNHFFDINFDFDKSAKYTIGNEKGSAIKLMILLQEIIFNAVKYSSFVKKDERFLKIDFSTFEEEITIKTENKYKPKVKIKTTGLGHVIIENFAKLLNTKPVIKKSNDIYSISIIFKNFWGK